MAYHSHFSMGIAVNALCTLVSPDIQTRRARRLSVRLSVGNWFNGACYLNMYAVGFQMSLFVLLVPL